MADLTDPVFQVTQQRKDENGQLTNFIGRFGADAEDIQIELKDNNNNVILACTLLDFFKNWEDFKENNAFMYHGEAGILNNQIKLWYGDSSYYISQQPQNAQISAVGDNVSFTVQANNTSGIQYLWQSSEDGGRTWTKSNINTATNQSATYTFSSSTKRLTYLFRCKVTFANKVTEYSNAVRIELIS